MMDQISPQYIIKSCNPIPTYTHLGTLIMALIIVRSSSRKVDFLQSFLKILKSVNRIITNRHRNSNQCILLSVVAVIWACLVLDRQIIVAVQETSIDLVCQQMSKFWMHWEQLDWVVQVGWLIRRSIMTRDENHSKVATNKFLSSVQWCRNKMAGIIINQWKVCK